MQVGEDIIPKESTQLAVPIDKFVLLIDNRKETRVLKIAQNKHFKWRKTPVTLAGLSKYPYFTIFQVGNHSLTPIQRQFEEDAAQQQEEVGAQDNNKEIYTLQQAQKLEINEIQRMKKEMKPEQIINELVDNNQQFSKRTAYSKQKYLKKKERKYMFHIQAEPITLAALHSHYYKGEARDVAWMRWDMLALLLLHGGPFGRVLLGEKGKGIVLAGLASRQVQRVVVGGERSRKSYPLLQQINPSHQTVDKIEFRGWKDILEKEQPESFTNLILVGNYDFASILCSFFPLLAGGSLITFFCISQQPLISAIQQAHTLNCLSVKLYDSWAREYQVLRNRTHPMMYMDGCSGFLFTAIKRGVRQ